MPQEIAASIMAFGAGVLLSAVSFELIAEANARAGLLRTALGAVVHTGCTALRPAAAPGTANAPAAPSRRRWSSAAPAPHRHRAPWLSRTRTSRSASSRCRAF